MFTRRYRVGENAKWQQEKLEGARSLVQALAEYAGVPGDWRMVGDTGLTDPMINAVQNTALQRTLGADAVSSRSAAVRGDFPDRVERVGRAERGTVYDNSLFTMLDTVARLGGRPAEDAPARPPAVGPGPANQAYSETWHGVVKPLLERAREVQGARLDAAPGMWQFDDFKGGGIYSGVPTLPPVPAPISNTRRRAPDGRSATAAETRLICSSVSSGNIGSDTISSAIFVVTGRRLPLDASSA